VERRGRDRQAGGVLQSSAALDVITTILATASISIVLTIAACDSSSTTSGSQKPVRAADLTTLRALRQNLALVTNPRTGDTLEYVVVGDGARSNELIVLFPGTGDILADWPVQMLTNSTSSPGITLTDAYLPAEDGPISLAHEYRLVLFDYPGVGLGTLSGPLTGDRIANDVDAMLDDIRQRYQIPTDTIDPLGWSLGTHLALKYTLVSPAARPDRTLHAVVLIATRPGGNTDGFTDGNQAACVSTLLTALEASGLDTTLKLALKTDLFKLIFPYVGQPPYNDIDSGCTATVDTTTGTIDLSVQPACPLGSACAKNFADETANRLTSPWSKTGGVDDTVYNQERAFDHDWNLCYCPSANRNFTSTSCSCSGTVVSSETNGGVCQTVSTGITTPNVPISSHCARLQFTGQLTVINGLEDLFIQWTYGRALVEGMQQALAPDKARLVTYSGPDGAGHGILMQHPRWTQEAIFDALQR